MIRNLRDVGKSVNGILGYSKLKQNTLYRGGSLDGLTSIEQLPDVKAIVNLRRDSDPEFCKNLGMQICPLGAMNNYQIESRLFQDWICKLFGYLSQNPEWPVLIHCNAGKDRTGVVAALLLKNIGISDNVIIEEYMKSDGILYPKSVGQLLCSVPHFAFLRMDEAQKSSLKSVLIK
ncbi:MAG: protein-tyrosine-phosphatase [Spirochaetales bacterium]|nr:protein-tyrosine-phosphatase [Spirochaetales bacterium]